MRRVAFLLIVLLAITGVASAQSSTQGGGLSTKAILALESCFDEFQNFTCGGGGTVTGTGTTNVIPRWTAASALGDGSLTDDGAGAISSTASASLSFTAVGGGSDISLIGGDDVRLIADDDIRLEMAAVGGDITLATLGDTWTWVYRSPPSAGAGWPLFKTAGTLNAMDGSDTIETIHVDITNADHTGSGNFLYGLNLLLDVADAEATEGALHMNNVWDSAFVWDTGSFTTSLAFTNPTADRTITFPDATGNVMLSAGLTNEYLPKWDSATGALEDSSVHDVTLGGGGSQVTIGYNNTYVFYTQTERTTPGSHSAFAFDYEVPVADGNDTMVLANFAIGDVAKAHTGSNNFVGAVVANTYVQANSNVEEYAFWSQGGAGYEADFRAGTGGVAEGRMSAPAGFQFFVDSGVVASASGDVFSFSTTNGLNAMNGSDTVEFVRIDVTNADHTGSGNFLYGLNLELNTADVQATESALHMTSTWDEALMWDTGSFTTSVGFTIPTADRTIDFPDASGTVAVVTSTAGFLTRHGATEGVLEDSDVENLGAPAAGSNGSVLEMEVTLNAMNGSDAVAYLELDVENANHTGSGNTLHGIEINLDTADAEAEEVAVDIGATWDYDWRSGGTLFANLGTPADGTFVYCSDCTIANPCAGSGTGALAKRLNSVWVCN